MNDGWEYKIDSSDKWYGHNTNYSVSFLLLQITDVWLLTECTYDITTTEIFSFPNGKLELANLKFNNDKYYD